MTQDKLDQIDQEIAKLETRKQELLGEHKATEAAIRERETTLGKSLLEKKPIEETIRFIERERVRVDGLENAASQTAKQLEELQTRRVEVERQIAIDAYEDTSFAVRQTLVAVLRDLVSANARLQAVPAYSPPREYKSAEATITRNMVDQMRTLELWKIIPDWERMAPALMKEAKANDAQ